jgi:hypothetical protein
MSVVQRMAFEGGAGQGPAGEASSLMVYASVGESAIGSRRDVGTSLQGDLKGFAWHKLELITLYRMYLFLSFHSLTREV